MFLLMIGHTSLAQSSGCVANFKFKSMDSLNCIVVFESRILPIFDCFDNTKNHNLHDLDSLISVLKNYKSVKISYTNTSLCTAPNDSFNLMFAKSRLEKLEMIIKYKLKKKDKIKNLTYLDRPYYLCDQFGSTPNEDGFYVFELNSN